MTIVIFILSSIFSALVLWSVKHSSIYENSELKDFKNINKRFIGNKCIQYTYESGSWSLLTVPQWAKTTSVKF